MSSPEKRDPRHRLAEPWLVDVVHRIQRERGASCAMVACGGKTAERCCGGGGMVKDFRQRTDASIGAGVHFEALASLREELETRLRAQRQAVDEATSVMGATQEGKGCAQQFFTNLMVYTECCAMLIERMTDQDLNSSPVKSSRRSSSQASAIQTVRAPR